MSDVLLETRGGRVVVPAPPLVDRADGGHLCVLPPREVWERSELTPDELVAWSFLVAATGRAMLDALPQLAGGCINYWDAGNWALHPDADPPGPKTAPAFRRVHLHLLGRSRSARHPGWTWGEAPEWPRFARRLEGPPLAPLSLDERRAVAARARHVLSERYRSDDSR